MSASVAAAKPFSAKMRRAVSRSCWRLMVGGRPICKSTYIYKRGLSTPQRNREPEGSPFPTARKEELESDSARQLHDALPGGEARRAERAQRGQHLGRAVVGVEGLVDVDDVMTVRHIERLGDELQLRSSEHRNVARDAGIDRELRREPEGIAQVSGRQVVRRVAVVVQIGADHRRI